MLTLAREQAKAYPGRIPWTDPPPSEGEEARVAVAIPGGPTR